MSSADLLEDGFPHGTPEGHEAGCKGDSADCPAVYEHGMSCTTAYVRATTTPDRYFKAKARDPRPAAIARTLGMFPKRRPVTDDQVAPTPAPATSVDVETAAPAPLRKPKATATTAAAEPLVVAEPAPAVAEPSDAAAAPTHTTREIRAWAIQKGYEVRGRGTIRQEIVDHYRDAHGLDPATDQPPVNNDEPQEITAEPVSEAAADAASQLPVNDLTPRPDWGALNLENDLAAALADRDQARDLAARLWDELDRSDRTRADEQAAHSATRRADADALDEARTDITNLTTALATARADRHALSEALAAASAALHTTERALELVLQKWDDATRGAGGAGMDAAVQRALAWYEEKGDWKTPDERYIESILRDRENETERVIHPTPVPGPPVPPPAPPGRPVG